MLCFIYKSLKRQDYYLYVSLKDDFSNVPNTLIHHFGTPEFVMELEINAETKLASEDSENVLNQLSTQGFFLQLPVNTTAIKPEKMH